MTKPATKDEIYKLLDDSREHVVGALLCIYSFQTGDEQDSQTTKYENQMGFNGVDAQILSDMSEFYNNKGFLSPKQIDFVRRSIKKYWGQLSKAGFSPKPIKGQTTEKGNGNGKFDRVVKHATMNWHKRTVKLQFSYPRGDDRFFKCVAAVKTLVGKKFDKENKWWTIPLSLESVEQLAKWKFLFDPDLLEWYNKMLVKPDVTDDIEIPGLQMELYPFQKEGVSFIEGRRGRALLGDEMGLGKTAQALAWLQLHPELSPVVIVVPASVKLNWAKEIRMWLQPGSYNLFVISGRVDIDDEDYQYNYFQQEQAGKGHSRDIFVINYDIIVNRTEKIEEKTPAGYVISSKTVEVEGTGWADLLKKLKPQVVIGDEIHYIKSNTSLRTKAFIKLSRGVKHVLGLSGTPIINRPLEFFNPIKVIEPALFPSFWDFAKKFCGATHNGYGWDFSGATNTDELHDVVTRHIMVRRLKSEVLAELPAKVRSVVPIELDNRKVYNKANHDIIAWIRDNEGAEKADKAGMAEVLVAFEKLKQLCVEGKMKSSIKWIEDFLDSEQKLVVFATHKKTVDDLMEHFGNRAVKLDGSVTGQKRQDAVDRFQTDDEIRLFVGNIKAAGIGITLTAASNTCFLELGWTPGEHDQAEDRVHRIGQEADSVNAYYLLADGTIENDIAHLLDEKRKVLASVLDGKKVDEKGILTELIKKCIGGG